MKGILKDITDKGALEAIKNFIKLRYNGSLKHFKPNHKVPTTGTSGLPIRNYSNISLDSMAPLSSEGDNDTLGTSMTPAKDRTDAAL